MTTPSEEEPVPWFYSDAKKLLTKDIVAGRCDGKKPKQVLEMHPKVYKPYKKNFSNNLRNLREAIADKKEVADRDAAAFAHDVQIGVRRNSKPYPIWQGSEAERLLKMDITNGKHLEMKPAELLATRPEYAPWVSFPKVFRDHIQQELRARKERPYWLARRKEKEMEKAKNAHERAKNKRKKAAKKAPPPAST